MSPPRKFLVGLKPSVWQHFRQMLGRALRETGQALDRVALKLDMLAVTPHDYYDDPVIYEETLSRHRQLHPLIWSGAPQLGTTTDDDDAADAPAFIAPCATLIGSVHVGRNASIWYGAILRADECLNARQALKTIHEEDSYDLQFKRELSRPSEYTVPTLPDNAPRPWPLQQQRFRDRIDHHGGCIWIGPDSNIQDGAIVTSRLGHTQIGQGVTVGHLAQIHSATVGDYSLIGMGSCINEGAVVEPESLVAAGAVVAEYDVVGMGELWVGNPARKLRDLTAEERLALHDQSTAYIKVAETHGPIQELGGNVLGVEKLDLRIGGDTESEQWASSLEGAVKQRQPTTALLAAQEEEEEEMTNEERKLATFIAASTIGPR